jgi:hypothetical protein
MTQKEKKQTYFPRTRAITKAIIEAGRVQIIAVALTALVLYIYYKMKGY